MEKLKSLSNAVKHEEVSKVNKNSKELLELLISISDEIRQVNSSIREGLKI